MSGVQKNKLGQVASLGVTRLYVPLSLVSATTQILAAPATGFVRKVLYASVLNLDTGVHNIQFTDGAAHAYTKNLLAVAVEASSLLPAVLVLNAGEALSVVLGATPTSVAPVATVIYQDFPVSSGLGGAKITIPVATSTTLVSGPSAGKRVIGMNFGGGVASVNFDETVGMAIAFVENNNSSHVITLTVDSQAVGVVSLSSLDETGGPPVVLLPGQSLTSTVAADPMTPITGYVVWQDTN